MVLETLNGFLLSKQPSKVPPESRTQGTLSQIFKKGKKDPEVINVQTIIHLQRDLCVPLVGERLTILGPSNKTKTKSKTICISKVPGWFCTKKFSCCCHLII